jgi:hypothetical protein
MTDRTQTKRANNRRKNNKAWNEIFKTKKGQYPVDKDDFGYFADYYQAEKTEQYVAAMEYDTELVAYYSTITTNFYDTFIHANEIVNQADERVLKIIEQYTNIINQLVLVISLIVALTASFLAAPYEGATEADEVVYKVILAAGCISGAIGVTDGIFLSIKLTDITTDFIGGQACDFIQTDVKSGDKTLYFRHFDVTSIKDLSGRITMMVVWYLFLLISTVICGAMLLDTRIKEFWSFDNGIYVVSLIILSIFIFFKFFSKYSYVINNRFINTVQNYFDLPSNQESLTAQLRAAIETFHQLQTDLYCIIHSHGQEMAKTIKTLNELIKNYEDASRKKNPEIKEFYYFEDIREYNVTEQLPGMNKRIDVFKSQLNRMRKNTFRFDEYTTEEMKDFAIGLKLTQLLSTINAQRTHMSYLFMRQARWNARCKKDNIYDWGKRKFSWKGFGLDTLWWVILLPQIVVYIAVCFLTIPVVIISKCIPIKLTWEDVEPYVVFLKSYTRMRNDIAIKEEEIQPIIWKVIEPYCRFEKEGEWKIKLNKELLNF